jgi:hypothetical protein
VIRSVPGPKGVGDGVVSEPKGVRLWVLRCRDPNGFGVWVLLCPDPRGLDPSMFEPKGVGV